MSEEITVYKPTNEVSPFADPRQEVNRAHEMAKVLQGVVKQASLSKAFSKGGKEHLFFEAWQTIGRFFNCAPEIEWSRPMIHNEKIIGWEARAVLKNQSGNVIASAESMCAKDEPNWATRPAYAIRSMAQTRASSKALRQAFAWVAVLAGYAPTPAEEMDGVLQPENFPIEDEKKKETQPKKEKPEDAASDAQRKALFAKGMERWGSRDKVKSFADWLLGDETYFTKKRISEVLDNFDGAAIMFEEDTQ